MISLLYAAIVIVIILGVKLAFGMFFCGQMFKFLPYTIVTHERLYYKDS